MEMQIQLFPDKTKKFFDFFSLFSIESKKNILICKGFSIFFKKILIFHIGQIQFSANYLFFLTLFYPSLNILSMQCTNCGYINFKQSKKCPSCNEAKTASKLPVEVAAEVGFTIFDGPIPEFSSGNGHNNGSESEFASIADADLDYPKPEPAEDFDLDLSEANHLHENGNGNGDGYLDTIEGVSELQDVEDDFDKSSPNDFHLDLTEATAIADTPTLINQSNSMEPEVSIDDDVDLDPEVSLDVTTDQDSEDIEGLGFDLDDLDSEITGDLDLDLDFDEETSLDSDDSDFSFTDENEEISLQEDSLDAATQNNDEITETSEATETTESTEKSDTSEEINEENEINFDMDTMDLEEKPESSNLDFEPQDKIEEVPPIESSDDDLSLELDGLELENEDDESKEK